MCGIAGIYLKDMDDPYLEPKEIETVVDWLLCGIEHRGTDATGIAVQDKDGKFSLEKSDMEAGKFIFWRRDIELEAKTILLHTRFATKGKPENLLNNHPIQYENIVAIHNGHISNDDELFKEEELKRLAQVDSEIIPALLHKYTFNEPKTALEKMVGGFAIAAFDQLNPGVLLLAKGSSSPLHYLETKGMFIWASEPKVIREALQFGLDFETKDSDIKELSYGRYMVINGDESEITDFYPAHKKWNPSPYVTGGAYTPKRSYTDGWDSYSVGGRDQCDECFVWYDAKTLENVGKDYYCKNCFEKLFDKTEDGAVERKAKKKLSRKERKRLRKQKAREFQESKSGETKTIIVPKKPEGIAEALDNEHWAICQLVAEFYSTKPQFVDFLLFNEDGISDFQDENLNMMYEKFHEKYEECLDIVRDDTNAIIEEMSACPTFPVGFGGVI